MVRCFNFNLFLAFVFVLIFIGPLGWGANRAQRIIVKYKRKSFNGLRAYSVNESFAMPHQRKIITVRDNVAIEDEIKSLNAQENVLYAVPDQVLTIASSNHLGSFSDEFFHRQWGLENSAGGINLFNDNINYDNNTFKKIVVAVVDTGVNFHPDLHGKILPGYDFISSTDFSNDGDGRDNDPSDPGDWASSDSPCFPSGVGESTWHGTHVAGIIAAKWNNGIGVVGINNNAMILPVRVLGKCGGLSSDIVDGMKWAAGLKVEGVPLNKNPAKIINLSLGGPGNCNQFFQEALNEIRAKGVLVVIASGNGGADLDSSPYTPATCQGGIVVGANREEGGLASYSNFGSKVHVLAPGGEDWNGIISTSNESATSVGEYGYKTMAGTSMAAPHISGIISVMLDFNADLVPSQIIDLIKSTATVTTGVGELGIVNAEMAILGAINAETVGVVDNYKLAIESSQSEYLQEKEDRFPFGCGLISLKNGGPPGPPNRFGFFLNFLLGVVLVGMMSIKEKIGTIILYQRIILPTELN